MELKLLQVPLPRKFCSKCSLQTISYNLTMIQHIIVFFVWQFLCWFFFRFFLAFIKNK